MNLDDITSGLATSPSGLIDLEESFPHIPTPSQHYWVPWAFRGSTARIR